MRYYPPGQRRSLVSHLDGEVPLAQTLVQSSLTQKHLRIVGLQTQRLHPRNRNIDKNDGRVSYIGDARVMGI